MDDLKILIYTENSEFNLNGISEKEYPSIELVESKNHIELSKTILKRNSYSNSICNKFR